jgi:hypothetical protein
VALFRSESIEGELLLEILDHQPPLHVAL